MRGFASSHATITAHGRPCEDTVTRSRRDIAPWISGMRLLKSSIVAFIFLLQYAHLNCAYSITCSCCLQGAACVIVPFLPYLKFICYFRCFLKSTSDRMRICWMLNFIGPLICINLLAAIKAKNRQVFLNSLGTIAACCVMSCPF